MDAQILNLERVIISEKTDYTCTIFCQKQVENRLLILTHHLKAISLSFQKIIKLTLLDQRN